MTISEPGLMSSGGSEKPPTLSEIEIGVSAILGTPSLSTSIQIKEINLSRSIKYHKFRLLKHGKRSKEGYELFSHDVELEGGYFYVREKWAWELIKNLAIMRFFEIWGNNPMSNEHALRGLGGNEELRSSISGMISTLLQGGAILPKNGKWVFNHQRPPKQAYSFRKALSPEAVQNCKRVAEDLAQKEKEANI